MIFFPCVVYTDMISYANILDSYEMATSLWKDKSKKLNHLQKKAVKSALQNQFSLILGPPGVFSN